MAADLRNREYWETSVLRSSGRLFMLAALSEQPRHGYDIARRISGFCGDWCSPSDAMIYPAIRDLESAGLIECHEESDGGRRRRVCELTDGGREALAVAADVWSQYLPALGRVVAAAQQEQSGEIAIDPSSCPTCCGGEAASLELTETKA
jgi:DNA-binding PadR family transcriptional regulator